MKDPKNQIRCRKCDRQYSLDILEGNCPACLLAEVLHDTASFDTWLENRRETDNSPDLFDEIQIDNYKILQQIGEGGFGIVYMAEQLQPVKRRVAVKVIKPGMDSRQIIARFEIERQALALMNHANIAKVFEAGTTADGRPFFVMELVRGVPITKYCDINSLTPTARLNLMIQVCNAIQHAHQKGIIHRDIKPSNVLVTNQDGEPLPKVIDFGVAKAMIQPLTDKTMFTRFGQVMGTLEYMSPEQAGLNASDVDTRGDVYSLGVLIYELLTGSTPLKRERLASVAVDELFRLIRDEEPQVPSIRLSESGGQQQLISSERGVDPDSLQSILRGDLDWIILKALEKDRSRRYRTAHELSEDIQRYLQNVPVNAAPPGKVYQLKKFYQRNKLAVCFGAVLATSIIAGLFATTFFFLRSENLRKQSEAYASGLSEEKAKLGESVRRLKSEQKQKAKALQDRTEALRETAALRLAAESALQRERNPGLAVALASTALETENDLSEAQTAMFESLSDCYEFNTVFFDEPIVAAAFSNDDEKVALRIDDRIEIWNLKSGTKETELFFHGGVNVAKMEFSTNKSRLAVLTTGNVFLELSGKNIELSDRVARVLSIVDNKELLLLKGHQDRVVSVEFSSDDSKILTASWDGTARLWDSKTGDLIKAFDYDETRCSVNADIIAKVNRTLESRGVGSLSLDGAAFQTDDPTLVRLDPANGVWKSLPSDLQVRVVQSDPVFDHSAEGTRTILFHKEYDEWSGLIEPASQLFTIVNGSMDTVLRGHWLKQRELRPPNVDDYYAGAEISDVFLMRSTIFGELPKLQLKGHEHTVIQQKLSNDRNYLFSVDRESLRYWRTSPVGSKIDSVFNEGKGQKETQLNINSAYPVCIPRSLTREEKMKYRIGMLDDE